MNLNLTKDEQLVLEWLGKEDYSQYGECHGSALNGLLEKGLVQIHQGREHQSGFIVQGDTDMYRVVSLTEAGRDALANVSHP